MPPLLPNSPKIRADGHLVRKQSPVLDMSSMNLHRKRRTRCEFTKHVKLLSHFYLRSALVLMILALTGQELRASVLKSLLPSPSSRYFL